MFERRRLVGGSGGSLGLKQPQVPVQAHHLLVMGHAGGLPASSDGSEKY